MSEELHVLYEIGPDGAMEVAQGLSLGEVMDAADDVSDTGGVFSEPRAPLPPGWQVAYNPYTGRLYVARPAAEPELLCAACDGEGRVLVVGAPGVWHRGLGQWLPSEAEVDCEECGGRGTLLPPPAPGDGYRYADLEAGAAGRDLADDPLDPHERWGRDVP